VRDKAAPVLIDAVLDVMNARLDAFKNKNAAPPAPGAELQAFRFLRNNAALATPAQSAQTMRGLAEVLDAIAPLIGGGQQSQQVDRDLRTVARTIGQEAQLAGARVLSPALTKAGSELAGAAGPGAPSAPLVQFAAKASAELNKAADLLAPPAPTTAPATKP
jgi:hypothetical protein